MISQTEIDFITVIHALEIERVERWGENPIMTRIIMEKVVRRLLDDPTLFPIIEPVFASLVADRPEFASYLTRAIENHQ